MEIFKLVGSIFINNDDANNSLAKTDEKAGNLGKTLLGGVEKAGKFAAGIAAAASAAAVGLGVKAVGAASDFESSFAKVTTLLSDTTDLDAYKKSIIDLSNQMGVSVSEINEAVYGAMSAGIEEGKAVEFVAGAMKLAEGGFTDAATAVDVVTTAINAYGLSAEDATAISDKLIMTQNLGKTTVDELASSMGKIIPTANSLNVDIDELCAGYAVLTSNGIATAESTTYMNSMLNELGKTGTKAQIALEKYTEAEYGEAMGIRELMEEGFGLNEVALMLQEQAEKTGLSITDMFGSAEAGKAANVLAQNADKFDDVFTKMADSAGTTEEAYEKMHGTMEAQMETFRNNLDNVMIQIGEQLMPIVNAAMDWVVEHMPEIQDFIGKVTDAISVMVAFIIEHMPEIKQIVNDAVQYIKALIEELTPIIEGLAPIVKALFDGFKELWESTLKPLLDGIIEFLQGVFTGNWEQIWQGLSDIVSGIFTGLIEIVKMPINAIIGLLNGAIDGFNKIQIPEWVPVVGGKGLNIPQIPLLAEGGDITEGGRAIVGEAGAEMIDLPKGARVTPLSGSAATLGADELENVIEMAVENVLSRITIPIDATPNTKKYFESMRAENAIWKAQHGGGAFA